MTLSEATDQVIGEAAAWVEANYKVRPVWTENNFPGMFLFACSQILPKTAEVGALYTYQRRATFRSRYLSYTISSEKGKLILVRFFTQHITNKEIIDKVNAAFSNSLYDYGMKGLDAKYNRSLIDKVERTRSKGFDVEMPIVYDTRKIDSFNFKTS